MSSNGPKMWRPPRKTSDTGSGLAEAESGGRELPGSDAVEWLVVDPVHPDMMTIVVATTRKRFHAEPVVVMPWFISASTIASSSRSADSFVRSSNAVVKKASAVAEAEVPAAVPAAVHEVIDLRRVAHPVGVDD